MIRVEICRDRHDQRSCKICSSCEIFSRKQQKFFHNLRRRPRFTHAKCAFTLKLLKFYSLGLIRPNTLLKLLILMHLGCVFVSKIVAMYALLLCITFGPKIWSCKFFDKSHVCEWCPTSRLLWFSTMMFGKPSQFRKPLYFIVIQFVFY